MPKWEDLSGRRFGALVVTGADGREERSYDTRWRCVCDCGTEKVILGRSLRAGTASCGCLQRRIARDAHLVHGAAKTKLYAVWSAMIGRCHDPRRRFYELYGGRGITVCDRWRRSFVAFRDDMGEAPSSAHTLDRVDSDRGYEPGNVRWATRAEQSRNRRVVKLSEEAAREIRCLRALGIEREWIAKTYGIRPGTVTDVTSRKSWA